MTRNDIDERKESASRKRLASAIVSPIGTSHVHEGNITIRAKGALNDMENVEQSEGGMLECDGQEFDLLGEELKEMVETHVRPPRAISDKPISTHLQSLSRCEVTVSLTFTSMDWSCMLQVMKVNRSQALSYETLSKLRPSQSSGLRSQALSYDTLSKLRPSQISGGSEGVFAEKTLEIADDILQTYKNQGGYDLLRKTKDKIRTTEQVNAALKACTDLKLDGLVIIGGVTSNTDAAHHAGFFAEAKCSTKIFETNTSSVTTLFLYLLPMAQDGKSVIFAMLQQPSKLGLRIDRGS
ncbi:unnamed protein product [Eruca vesicaria subsp. sativa]|uniref:Uncharacterized protein n=1 Tax=Eruca vesicaria subsp. sativa TaxID=29727 RepID=A0ABC8J5N4_ERUVS|nr:unnamed protein product [Eruca vesicaria subsp. sativa]